jgi:hypothetical protein
VKRQSNVSVRSQATLPHPRAGLGRALLVLSWLVASAAMGGVARADDADVVDVIDGVAMEELPLGSAFVLNVTHGPDVKSVRGLFLEYARGAFGSKAGSEIENCSEFSEVAEPLAAAFENLSPGETHVKNLFKEKTGGKDVDWSELKKRPALLLPAWNFKEGVSEDGKATLRVPKTSFFRRGVHYCLVIIEVEQRERENHVVEDMVAKIVYEIDNCPAKDRAACETRAMQMVDQEKLGLSNEARNKLREAIGDGVDLALARVALKEALNSIGTYKAGEETLTPVSNEPDHSLFTFIAKALVADGRLVEQAGVFKSKDDKPLLELRIGSIDVVTAIFQGPGATKITEEYVTASTKVGSGLALRDVLAIARGRVALASKHATFSELESDAFAKDLFSKATEHQALWHEARDTMRRVSAMLEEEPTAASPVLVALHDWADKVPEKSPLWIVEKDEEKADEARGLLNALAASVADFSAALDDWAPRNLVIVEIVTKLKVMSIDTTLGLNPETWFFSFVVPTVGYGATSGAFGIPTVALNIYLFPSSADEPMWVNGADDLRRLVSLQLGVAPLEGGFGPSDRYSGPADLPPLLFGMGLQLIPYTNVSAGVMLVDVKRTTLDVESPDLRPLFYFNASLQTNIPDIVMTAVNGKDTATD